MNINLFKLTEQFKQKREINFILISEILKFSSIFHTLTTFSSGTLRCAPRVLFEHTHTQGMKKYIQSAYSRTEGRV